MTDIVHATAKNRQLVGELPTWGLFGNGLLLGLCWIVVIPAPWAVVRFYKFFCNYIALPDGRRLRFVGQIADIWPVAVGMALLGWAHYIPLGRAQQAVSLALTIAGWALVVRLMQWFCANLRSSDDRLKLEFVGGYWAYIGWQLLLLVSFITIIGWAWVFRAMMQWVCRNVRGNMTFDFTASGLSVLGHFAGFFAASLFIVPIPWIWRWLTNWMVSQISAQDPAEAR
jgi:hypothetical protein